MGKVTRKVLGFAGKNVKAIATRSGAKLRVRGKGSGFVEGPEQQESSDPLMLCVSAQDQVSYSKAKALVWELMEDVYGQYRAFCDKHQLLVPELQISIHEGARPGSY